jgi:hypothetical protein
MFHQLKVLWVALAVTLSAQAAPVVLTFEGVQNTIYNTPQTVSGITMGNVAGDVQHFHFIDSTGYGLVNNGTGVLENDRLSRLFFELATPGVFTLTSFDISTVQFTDGNRNVSVEGFLNGVSTGIITTLALNSGYTTVNGAGLGLVDRIVFGPASGTGENGFNLDNVAFEIGAPVPEMDPQAASLPLFSALVMLLLARGRRRSFAEVWPEPELL